MPFLEEAINSIINQTYSNLEILCINDGSTDGTGSFLESCASKDSRIKVIHNEHNFKLIKTLNKGVKLAQGQYIARMDADDIADPRRIQIQYDYLKLNPHIDLLSCGLWVISEEGNVISKIIPRQHNSIACLFASFFYVPVGHPELLIKSSVLKDNLFLEEDYAIHTEDYELWTRLLRKGYQLQNINDLLHYFRINSKSISRTYTQIQDNNFVACAHKHYELYTRKKYTVNIVRVLVNRINSDTKYEDVIQAFKTIKEFKNYFIIKEKKAIDRMSLNEIKVIYYTHFFDICYQIVKNMNYKAKFFAVYKLLSNFNMFFLKGVQQYLLSKF
jgi:glycosyltransferase involved in cell wall biosynthesis